MTVAPHAVLAAFLPSAACEAGDRDAEGRAQHIEMRLFESPRVRNARRGSCVMAGLVPAIHARLVNC